MDSVVKDKRKFRGGKRRSQKKAFKDYIRRRDNYTCQLCGNYGYECDHIIPFAISGETTIEGSRVLCTRCNRITRRKRRDARPEVWDISPRAQEIRRLRLKLGLTQKALAERVGVGQMMISNIETGWINDGRQVLGFLKSNTKKGEGK